MGGKLSSSYKGQNAVEYLITYGWALLIIIAAVAIIYFYVAVPMSIPKDTCTFVVGVTCNNYAVSFTNHSTDNVSISLMLSNPEYYPIKSPVMVVSSSSSNFSSSCSPSFVNPGANFVCTLKIPDNFGTSLMSYVYIKEYNCGLSKYGEFNGTCADPPLQIYKGVLDYALNKNIPTLPTRMEISPSTLTLSSGGVYPINSTFMFAGSPTKSININYTLNNSDARLQSPEAFTGTSGTASDTLYALHPGTLKVTSSFDGYSSNSIIIIS